MLRMILNVCLTLFLAVSLVGCNKNSNSNSQSSNTLHIKQTKVGNEPIRKDEDKPKTRISAVTITPYPASVAAIVNKKYYLPVDYIPKDLVYPNVPFLFKEKIEKRKMRREAAAALEKLFAAAKKSGINLSGVSAYRSYATQKVVFDNYVKRDGFEKARTYSAVPGSSEHQTGLAIDVSGASAKCAVESCFEYTSESYWLSKNVGTYGFIIRYPKGKEKITGYKYEPWHLRYVGTISKPIQSRNLTLEEYYGARSVLNKTNQEPKGY